MSCRRAVPADAVAVAALWTEAYSDDPRGGRSAAYDEAEFVEAQRLGEVWVADGARGLAGVVVLYPPAVRPGQHARGGEVELSRLAVATGARRRGLARKLVELCVGEAAGRGAEAIVLWSQPHQVEAHRLYELLGFRRVPDRDDADAEGPRLVFVKELRSLAQEGPLALVGELHRRQGDMYAGGPVEPVLELLAPDVVWRVPGESPIAGTHRGHSGVSAYFERRRQLASATMRMHPGPALVEADAVAQFVIGTATLGGRQVSWRTLGVYRLDPDRRAICEVWLVPTDAELFDRLWTPPPG